MRSLLSAKLALASVAAVATKIGTVYQFRRRTKDTPSLEECRVALVQHGRSRWHAARDQAYGHSMFLLRCFDALHDGVHEPPSTTGDAVVLDASAQVFALRRIHNLDHTQIGLLLMKPPQVVYEWEVGIRKASTAETYQLITLESIVAEQYQRDREAKSVARQVSERAVIERSFTLTAASGAFLADKRQGDISPDDLRLNFGVQWPNSTSNPPLTQRATSQQRSRS